MLYSINSVNILDKSSRIYLFYKNKLKEIKKYSDVKQVAKLSHKYFLNHGIKNKLVYLSNKVDKKYMLQDLNGKFIHFGQMGYEDFTKHKDKERRDRYLKRSTNILGNWKNNIFSPNNLSIHILW
jgi:hypothetical protein